MNYFCIALFFFVQVFYAQTSVIDQGDKLASTGKYPEEIALRKAILDTISDRDSEVYKTQSYKLKLAEYHLATDPADRASHIAKAEELYHSLENQDPFIRIELGMFHFEALAQVLAPEGKDKVIEICEFALQQSPSPELDEWLAYIYFSRGRSHLYYQELDDAILYLDKSLEKNIAVYGYNSMETANVFNDIAIAHTYTNNYPAVLMNADKALEIYETIQPKDPFVLFNQYAQNFQGHKYYGDISKLKELHVKIQDYFEANKHNNSFINLSHPDFRYLKPVPTTYYYVELQYATTKNDPIAAEKAFGNFKAIMPKTHVEYTTYEINQILSYHLETGTVFHRLDNSDIENYYKARKYYSAATDFAHQYGFDFGELQSYMMLSILGVDYGQWEDVVTYSEKALNHPNIGIFNQTQTIKHNLGLAYGEMREFDKVFEVLEEEYEYYLNNKEVDYYSLTNLIESGNLYLELYAEKPERTYVEKAYNNFHLASVIFSKLYRGGEFSDRLQTFSSQINHGLLLASLELKENQKVAIERVEINNSDYLWSNFLKNSQDPLNPESLAAQMHIDSLQEQQRELASRIESEVLDKEELQALRQTLKDTEKQFNSAQAALQKRDNAYYQFSRTDFDLDRIQKNMLPNQRIIKYIQTDASVFAYVMGPKDLRLVKLEITGEALEDELEGYLTSLKEIKPDYQKKAKSLHAALVEPLSIAENTALIIVPDRSLAYLPFETLMDQKDQSIIDKHAVSYGYSLKLMHVQNELKGSFNGQLAAFSPDYGLEIAQNSQAKDVEMLVRNGNYQLAGANEESNLISAIFKGDLFLGGAATKSNFIEKSSSYDILHLAMHAIIDEENPESSNLIFGNDERLYLDELYNLKIPAHLAVLSACNTGFGKIKSGEGVQSLSRAFTYAGVKSTVMSLWPVPDKQTSEIMTAFYKHLKAGETKSEALRLAKLDYIKNTQEAELKHPYYWAGFLINGDVDPLKTAPSQWWYFGLGAVLLILIFYFVSSRKRTKG